ncbi:TetR/AcrR family transcriptional regulator [Parvibium lacunae]|uniref:TetR/AcrR family transcriptional regulator n=1 Tax=Parvibium lacunae TaxID=1888893 RepID=A0A368L6T7_9BURK|nr:TetR/AcrR family transcriptional regulator [Parvibium lacunae]RCS59337.1 TetR/AcrR family transcriptional regulator [Parvibium lacunae]
MSKQTREKILTLSLQLFNEFGEPNVTTSMIAEDLKISPGNLYYHFRNKDDIVNCLFEVFAKSLTQIIAIPEERKADLDDAWQSLAAFFKLSWEYRFIYRDMNDLLYRNRMLEVQIKDILQRKIEIAARLCKGLRKAGQMEISDNDLQIVATNLALIATYWSSFHYALEPRSIQQKQKESMRQGIYQVLSLLQPYLAPAAAQHLALLVHQWQDQFTETGSTGTHSESAVSNREL